LAAGTNESSERHGHGNEALCSWRGDTPAKTTNDVNGSSEERENGSKEKLEMTASAEAGQMKGEVNWHENKQEVEGQR